LAAIVVHAESRRTLGISCEAVRTSAKRWSALGGASVWPGAAESFVSFIPLLGGFVIPSERWFRKLTRRRLPERAQWHCPGHCA
jgi:hypothetical protein